MLSKLQRVLAAAHPPNLPPKTTNQSILTPKGSEKKNRRTAHEKSTKWEGFASCVRIVDCVKRDVRFVSLRIRRIVGWEDKECILLIKCIPLIPWKPTSGFSRCHLAPEPGHRLSPCLLPTITKSARMVNNAVIASQDSSLPSRELNTYSTTESIDRMLLLFLIVTRRQAQISTSPESNFCSLRVFYHPMFCGVHMHNVEWSAKENRKVARGAASHS